MTTLRYDADALVTSVRTHARLPDTNSGGSTDEDILRNLNEELVEKFLPVILAVREDYLTFTERVSLSASTSLYRLPKRAAGQKLTHVAYRKSSSDAYQKLDRINRSMRYRYGVDANARPYAYFLDWNHLHLVPDIGSSPEGILEFTYYFRPSEVKPVAEIGIVSAVDTGTGLVTIAEAALPDGWDTTKKYDFHSPESGSEVRNFGLTPSATGTNDLTFTATDIDGSGYQRFEVEVGDYVCLEKECGVPFLPRELHGALAKQVAVTFLRAQGDNEAADKLMGDVQVAMSGLLGTVLEERVEDQPQVITNPYSFLRSPTPSRTLSADQFP